MAIHVHFEYQEKNGFYIFEGNIDPTPEDYCEYMGIENPTKDQLDIIANLWQYDLLNDNEEGFAEFIKAKYYDIKRY